jgi:hypothetical protein
MWRPGDPPLTRVVLTRKRKLAICGTKKGGHSMPGWLKALLAVVIIVVLLVVGLIVGGVVWWSRNKDRLIGSVKQSMTEGREYGRTTDNQGCVDESLSRYKKDPGFSSVISTNLFDTACLEVSRSTPGFCDDVPKTTEFMKSGQWRADQCRKAALSSDSYCQQLFQPLQQFCERPRRTIVNDNENSNNN